MHRLYSFAMMTLPVGLMACGGDDAACDPACEPESEVCEVLESDVEECRPFSGCEMGQDTVCRPIADYEGCDVFALPLTCEMLIACADAHYGIAASTSSTTCEGNPAVGFTIRAAPSW